MLPPLLAELRNEKLQALVLPLVLNIIPRQEAQDFMDWTLPALLPIATSVKARLASHDGDITITTTVLTYRSQQTTKLCVKAHRSICSVGFPPRSAPLAVNSHPAIRLYFSSL